MTQENLFMYKRLINKKPTYDINKYIKEYELNQYYKQNACKFPCMNFYKEKENNKDKYIFSFSTERNKKEKSKIICRTNSDFFPKITNTITTRSTRNNSLEEYGNKKIIKRRKKKFKNFTLNDLKNLKIKINKNKLFFDLMIPNKINNNYFNRNINSNSNRENNENNLNSENNEIFDDKNIDSNNNETKFEPKNLKTNS